MKAILPSVSLLLIVVNLGFAQNDLTELDKRNGFKDIKMTYPIDSVKGAKFKKDISEKGNHPAKLYEVLDPSYLTIGDVRVSRIEVKTYKNYIYEILVITDKDTRLMKGMESALGKPVYDVRNDTYKWTGRNLSLTFKPASKNELELLYTSYVVHKMMKDDKKKKIDAIADDF
ncbi:hypothetical protein QQ054_14085 [Oscillatoria amoena NRMC-F 0135]|nr:hypothetical protein [Oscillatoria amoena NRMC-F 0135]